MDSEAECVLAERELLPAFCAAATVGRVETRDAESVGGNIVTRYRVS